MRQYLTQTLMLVAVALFATSCSSLFNSQKIEIPTSGLSTKVVQCVRKGDNIVIDMVLTNNGADEEIVINGLNVTLYDNVGGIYRHGDNTTISFSVGGSRRTQICKAVYPKNIPLRLSIDIGDVAPYATHFRLIEIGARSYGNMALRPENPIVLRNIMWVNSQ